jgi:hypothetical protein
LPLFFLSLHCVFQILGCGVAKCSACILLQSSGIESNLSKEMESYSK